jgi:hypothetical protein
VAEWVEQKILPMHKQLAAVKANADSIKKRRTWPVRPFEVSPELADLGIVPKEFGKYHQQGRNSPSFI